MIRPDCRRPLWAALLIPLLMPAHGLAVALGAGSARILSIAFLTSAPLLASLACMWRARGDDHPGRWHAVALAMALWAGGMGANIIDETIFANMTGVSVLSSLLFVLFGVPLIFVAASPSDEQWRVRWVDGALALVLGVLFFIHTTSLASTAGASAADVVRLRLMFDIENLFIAIFYVVRSIASTRRSDRDFFACLAAFGLAYLLAAGYINHWQSSTDYGGPLDLIVDLPFQLLAALAAWWPSHRDGSMTGASRAIERTVRAASPLMLPAMLLAVSGALVSLHLALAVGGFIIAMLGYGLRSVLVQINSYDRNDALERLSTVDALTGLANRRQFNDQLIREFGRARRAGEPLALLMIDIDHFKALNDGLGHLVGDERLREVASALGGCAMRATDLVARYGGEEFAAILTKTSLPQARALAETMRIAVEELQLPSARGGVVTISIGLALADPAIEGVDAETVLGRADAALYAAKTAGRNRVVAHIGEVGATDDGSARSSAAVSRRAP